jgi:hypothetical protein
VENQQTFFDFAAEVRPTKVQPPPELVAWASQDVGACVQPLTADEWVGLLENAGLQDITVRIHSVDVKKEPVLLLRRYGYGGMIGSATRRWACISEPGVPEICQRRARRWDRTREPGRVLWLRHVRGKEGMTDCSRRPTTQE